MKINELFFCYLWGMWGNQYHEKWTLEASRDFLIEAITIAIDKGHDFIGEVAKDQNTYLDVYDYLVDKFPELSSLKTALKRACETNCFSNGKKGDINTAMAIMNLKSNHGWTDRIANDLTTKGEKINPPIRWVDEPTE